MSLTIEEIQRWDADEMTRRLAGAPEDVAEILAVGADAGVTRAQALYGQILLDGHGVSRDPTEALRWFGLAAQAGDPMAMNMVGRCCEHGWGTEPNPALAADWYGAAADRGLDWGMYNLATLLCLGCGVAEDRGRALDLYRRASALGHVKSVNMIGGFYEDGWVVERDMQAAAHHYAHAAEGGDFRGQFNHARMLIEEGRLDEASDWLRQLPATATPRFLERVCQWLASRSEPALQAIAHEFQNNGSWSRLLAEEAAK